MSICRYRLFLVIAALVGCAGAVAQQAGAAAIAPDDPELYFGFFSLQQAIQKDISAAKDAPSGAALQQAAARHFNISEADFVILGSAASAALERVSAFMRDAHAHLQSEIAAGRRPDGATFEALNKQRLAILQDAANALQKSMSPAGWKALHSYINDEYRSHIVRTELSHAK